MTVNKYVEELFKDREKLFAFKKVNKIYLKDIAEYIGVSMTMISLYDTGKREMRESNLKKYKRYIENCIKQNKDSKLK